VLPRQSMFATAGQSLWILTKRIDLAACNMLASSCNCRVITQTAGLQTEKHDVWKDTQNGTLVGDRYAG
jgi:hypothetical protein